MNFISNKNEKLFSSLKYFYDLGDAVSLFLELKNVSTELNQKINQFVNDIPLSIDANNNTQHYISTILHEDIVTINKLNEESFNAMKDLINFEADIKYSKKLTTDLFERFSKEQEIILDYKLELDIFKNTLDEFQKYFNNAPNLIYMQTNSTLNINYKKINILTKIINDVLPLYQKLISQHIDAINQLNKIGYMDNQ